MVQGSRWSDTLRMAPCTLLAETDCRADEEHSDEHPDYRKVNPNVCEAGATKHHRLQTIEKCDAVYRVENKQVIKER